MYEKIAQWLDAVLTQEIPDETAAFNLNLYDDSGDWWALELIAADRFAADDGGDWACFEIADFGTREEPLRWRSPADGEAVQEEVLAALRRYLAEGRYAAVLKSRQGVGAGFVDGDLTLLYTAEHGTAD